MRVLLLGVIAAVLGEQQVGGEFLVADVVFAGMPAQLPLPSTESDLYVGLVSGFQLGNRSLPNALPTHLVVDWLNGELGTPAVRSGVHRRDRCGHRPLTHAPCCRPTPQDQTLSASVAHVVIAGNLLWTDTDDDTRAAASTVCPPHGPSSHHPHVA